MIVFYPVHYNSTCNYSGKALDTGTFPSTVIDHSFDSVSIALTSDNTIYTWDTNHLPSLVADLPLGKTFTKVIASDSTFYALTDDNLIYSWGGNDNGETLSGTPSVDPVDGPTLATDTGLNGGEYFIDIYRDSNKGCFGLTNMGDVYGWGYNVNGKIGTNDSSTYVFPPTKLSNLSDIVYISDSGSTMFAVDSNNIVYDWGSESNASENVPAVYDGIYDLDSDSLTGSLPVTGVTTISLLAIALLALFLLKRSISFAKK